MHANRRVFASAALLLLLATAGLVEAIRIAHAGLIVLLAASLLVALAMLFDLRGRTHLTLRADLATWVTRTTAATGEPPEHLVDRAVSSYRVQLDGASPSGDEVADDVSDEVTVGDG